MHVLTFIIVINLAYFNKNNSNEIVWSEAIESN